MWRWETYDQQGQIVGHGDAGSRREAAAFVIREIVRSSALAGEQAA